MRSEGASASRPTSEGARSSRPVSDVAAGDAAKLITTFVAEVLPENRAMLDVFRDGFDAHVRFHDGTDTAEFPTAAWRLARERFEQAL